MEKDIATAFTCAVLLFRKYHPSSLFYITFLPPFNRVIYLIAGAVMILIPSCVQRMGGGSLQYNTTVGELMLAVAVHKCADCWLGFISSLPLLWWSSWVLWQGGPFLCCILFYRFKKFNWINFCTTPVLLMSCKRLKLKYYCLYLFCRQRRMEHYNNQRQEYSAKIPGRFRVRNNLHISLNFFLVYE